MVMMAHTQTEVILWECIQRSRYHKTELYSSFSKAYCHDLGNNMYLRTLSGLLCSSAMHSTDVHYETQAIIFALWPNVRILAARRWSLASSLYFAMYVFIQHQLVIISIPHRCVWVCTVCMTNMGGDRHKAVAFSRLVCSNRLLLQRPVNVT